ncbi:alpha/beta hydrolase [Thalassomonas haliotis]|uniref:Alpha/beta fold hydrolase n=1 Tax=Thalassomonas haliotis TaxID=485448 RepID=A0ABY7VA67_9GAMM|nr:alpha/beta fold hydrolase [Thalassomonas haliotis]WDE10185.1 alpha/beta fold hydrolase [Thalassomonas haliotis]
MLLKKLFTLFLCGYILSGCTSLGSYVIANPNIYLSEAKLLDVSPESKGFKQKTFCLSSEDICIPYLTAEPYNPDDFKGKKGVYYNLHAGGNGIVNEISHHMAPDSFNRFKGTAVLLHGYGASKEAMMITAFYFRALGMTTVLPDLYGHGDSGETFKFAAREHVPLAKLLSSLRLKSELQQPVILVGHSMGGLPSVNLLREYSEASAAILLAPMLRFDQAAKRYFSYKFPDMSKLISEQRLGDIVNKAMADAGVTLADTDIIEKAKQVDKPMLIIHSDVDSVSPASYFSQLTSEHIQLAEFRGRSHPSLIAFSKKNAEVVEKWLSGLQNNKVSQP